nr:MAG TPA: hypothetical protein [Caudoviricetes sp.]
MGVGQRRPAGPLVLAQLARLRPGHWAAASHRCGRNGRDRGAGLPLPARADRALACRPQ